MYALPMYLSVCNSEQGMSADDVISQADDIELKWQPCALCPKGYCYFN